MIDLTGAGIPEMQGILGMYIRERNLLNKRRTFRSSSGTELSCNILRYSNYGERRLLDHQFHQLKRQDLLFYSAYIHYPKTRQGQVGFRLACIVKSGMDQYPSPPSVETGPSD
jgi:hypothetical protein